MLSGIPKGEESAHVEMRLWEPLSRFRMNSKATGQKKRCPASADRLFQDVKEHYYPLRKDRMEPRHGGKNGTGFHWETEHESLWQRSIFVQLASRRYRLGSKIFLVKYFSVFEEKGLNFRCTNIGGVKSRFRQLHLLKFGSVSVKMNKIGRLLLTELS